MGDLLSPTHIVFLLIIALLVFGPRKLPELGGAVGKTIREFQKSMREATQARDAGEEAKPPSQDEPKSS